MEKTKWQDRFDARYDNENPEDSSSIWHSQWQNGKQGHMMDDIKQFIEAEMSLVRGEEEKRKRGLRK